MTKMRTGYLSPFSVTLLTLGLLASTLVGCASLPVQENDALAGYRQELAKLVEAGVLTKEDEKKFYQIATLEMERRAKQRQGPPTVESRGARNHPSLGHIL